MSKKIYIGENDLIKIKRFMTGRKTGHKPFIAENEPPYEEDEFEIGGEGGNNDYFHINESAHADLDIIDSISYSVDEKYYFDEEEYKHWYDNYDSEDEYLKSCERYDGEVYDTDGNHIDFFSGDRDEIEYYFRDNLYIAEKIFNKEGRYSQGEYWITDIQDEFVNEMDVNINDVDSVNKAAKRLSKPNGASQFILTDGSIIAFHDHAQIQSVCYGMTISKFLELGNIRCGGGNVVTIELIKQPTYEQQSTLKNLLAYADEAIVDFAEPNKNDNMYPEMVHSVTYKDPDNRRVVNDIMNYFWEGIKPISEDKLVSKGKKVYIDENKLAVIKENIESEVESNEVKLDSFKKNDSLAKRIWDGMDLNPRVRLKLLDIADDFWDFTDINWVKPKGIHLTGSICNFNWSDESDIDLHLVVDFSEVDDRKDFVQEYFNSKKNEWNEEHSNLKIFGYPVELYVEDVNAETVSSGIYDLEENKWISEPSKDEIEEIGLDKYEIKSLAAKLMTKIDGLYDEFSATDDDAKLRSIGERADKLLSSIKQMRKDGLSRGGESDPFNVVYKVLRRADYLENLFNLKSELYDKLNSIDIEENVIKYYYNKIYPLNEEIVADGSAEHNPFKKRWKYEREALKSYLCNNGEIMTSKENGKQYKVIFDTMLSQRLGLNYCICIQWNPITMEPGNIIYVRAYDKFTKRIFTPQFDARGYDNVQGTSDDVKL